MKKLIIFFCTILCTAMVSAQDYSAYYADMPVQIKQVKPVVIPEARVSLNDFQGVADGKTLNTTAISNAIEALSNMGGGHLIIPAGTWKTGPIELRSNIDLHLERGATLLFSEDKSLYVRQGERKCLPFIRAMKCENVAITGQGTIDGQGEYWRPVKRGKCTDEEWKFFNDMGGEVKNDVWLPFNLNNGIPNIAPTAEKQEALRNYMIHIIGCKNILVEGVKIYNSPKFHLVPSRCENLIIDGVTIECPWNAQNGDALDIGNTQTALVVNSHITCGDDGICMKGGSGQAGLDAGPNSDFLIQNDTVLRAHGGFVIGSDFCGGMHKLIVRNCYFDGTDIGLRFKSAPGRGGTCSNIFCYDIKMKDIRNEAILYQTTYADKGAVFSATASDDKSAFYPDFCNMSIHDIDVDGAKTAFLAEGLPGHPVHDISLENVMMKNCDMDIKLSNVENISMTNCKFEAKRSGSIDSETCKNVTISPTPALPRREGVE